MIIRKSHFIISHAICMDRMHSPQPVCCPIQMRVLKNKMYEKMADFSSLNFSLGMIFPG